MYASQPLNPTAFVAHCDVIRTQLLSTFDFQDKRMLSLKGESTETRLRFGEYRLHSLLKQSVERREIASVGDLTKGAMAAHIERQFVQPGASRRFTEHTQLTDDLPVDVMDDYVLWKAAKNFLTQF